MNARLLALPLLVLLAASLPHLSQAATFTVTKTADSGTGTLRWAIDQANANAGADVVTFAAGLSGKIIKPTTALPLITDAGTTVDGDIDDDRKPDVGVDGQSVLYVGLYLKADNCVVDGLALMHFKTGAILVGPVSGCQVKNCHLGADLSGTHPRRNGFADILITGGGSGHVIGGPDGRNLFTCGEGIVSHSAGVHIQDSSNNQVANNYFGLDRSGMNVIGSDGYGVVLETVDSGANNNIIKNNVFAHTYEGVYLVGAHDNRVQGNLFGLAADGEAARALEAEGVMIAEGAQGNVIGGTTSQLRNVFGAMKFGVRIAGTNTKGNRVMGNYFGTNQAGTRQKNLMVGVQVSNGAGPQTIGGSTPSAGNYITAKWTVMEINFGVNFEEAGAGSSVRNNKIGVRPDGRNAVILAAGVRVRGVRVNVTDNVIARCTEGISAGGLGTIVEAYRNTLRDCQEAVGIINSAVCRLGNLGNSSTDDDGGNDFKPSNAWFIINYTSNGVKAEGNEFHTTVRAEIDAKIYDKLDDPTLGRVDFIPLAGGIIPTGETEGALAIAGLTAVPTSRGAEIAFSLSAPARVTITVLNLAGRPVATVAVNRPARAGLQRVAWSGRTNAETVAPAGRYVVRVDARDEHGREARALTAVGRR